MLHILDLACTEYLYRNILFWSSWCLPVCSLLTTLSISFPQNQVKLWCLCPPHALKTGRLSICAILHCVSWNPSQTDDFQALRPGYTILCAQCYLLTESNSVLLKFERLYLFFISILIGTAFPFASHMLISQTDLKMDIVYLDCITIGLSKPAESRNKCLALPYLGFKDN